MDVGKNTEKIRRCGCCGSRRLSGWQVVESHLVIRNAKSSGCFACKRGFGRDFL